MISVKKNGSLSLAGSVRAFADEVELFDMTGWSGASDIRRPDGSLVATLTFTWLDPAERRFLLTHPDPSNWPEGQHQFDIVFTSPTNERIPTATQKIQVLAGVTHG